MTTDERVDDATDMVVPGYEGDPMGMRTVFQERTSEREIILVITPDRMRAYMRVVPTPDYSGLTRETVEAVLAAAGVTHGVVQAGIDLLIAIQNSSEPYNGFFQVARGDPMRTGEDASIEFHVQPTSLEARYDENDDGGIDFKQLNLIENCFAGQRVASIIPPGPGRPGIDVFGEEIPPQPGQPVLVQPGPGILMSSNGRDFTSEIEGRLVFDDNVLSISPLLEIARDIDYSVGNVDFVGKVTVKGSLLDGFYINAKRGVELLGDMGAGRITSEGDVKITGGIKGKNAAIITCRNLEARYIDDATVEASGDVTATKEIINSSVKALGRVTTSGAIIGGVVCGFQGVEADTLGSEMGVTTWVMSGLDWTEENRKDEIRGQLAEYLDRVQSAKVLLDPLFVSTEITARLGSEQKSMLADLISELRDLRELMTELLEERTRIESRDQIGIVNQINVRKMLYMGVNTRFSEVDGSIKDAVKGPVTVLQDTQRDTLEFAAWVNLPKPEKSVSDLLSEADEATGGVRRRRQTAETGGFDSVDAPEGGDTMDQTEQME
ncbi:MAG: FapA family protein [Planctomycetaceae bacterium]|nr:FapA family protein [Planctomycetaceae bacterium]